MILRASKDNIYLIHSLISYNICRFSKSCQIHLPYYCSTVQEKHYSQRIHSHT